MKIPSLAFLVLLFAALSSTALAKGKAKHKPQPAAPAQPNTPAEKLAFYIEHVDALLALYRNAPKEIAPAINEASGRVPVLRQSFAAELAKADDASRASLQSSIATCDRISAALDERQKFIAQMNASSAVHAGSDLGARRKDELGKRSDPAPSGLASAVNTIADYKREKNEKKDLKRKAAQTDAVFDAAAVQRWEKRSVELRQQITKAYSGITS